MQTLKDIALELLDKYRESEADVINNYGGNIEQLCQQLKDECQAYRDKIETAPTSGGHSEEYQKIIDMYNELLDDYKAPHRAVCPICGKGFFYQIGRVDPEDSAEISARLAQAIYVKTVYITDQRGLQHQVIHTGDLRVALMKEAGMQI